MRDMTIYEIEFREHGNPKGPDYRWFSKIGHALEFMNAIPGETHISEMTFRAHVLAEGAPGVAQFLNHLTGDRRELNIMPGAGPNDELPF